MLAEQETFFSSHLSIWTNVCLFYNQKLTNLQNVN